MSEFGLTQLEHRLSVLLEQDEIDTNEVLAVKRQIRTAKAAIQAAQVARTTEPEPERHEIAPPPAPVTPNKWEQVKAVSADTADTTDIAEAARKAAELKGIVLLEQRGDWLWLHGYTRDTAPQLRAIGFKYSSKKTAALGNGQGVWYWAPPSQKRKYRKSNVPEDQIRRKYGARSVLNDD